MSCIPYNSILPKLCRNSLLRIIHFHWSVVTFMTLYPSIILSRLSMLVYSPVFTRTWSLTVSSFFLYDYILLLLICLNTGLVIWWQFLFWIIWCKIVLGISTFDLCYLIFISIELHRVIVSIFNLIVILVKINILGLLAIKCGKLEFILIETLIGRKHWRDSTSICLYHFMMSRRLTVLSLSISTSLTSIVI